MTTSAPYIPDYPLRTDDGEPLVGFEANYPPPYGFRQFDDGWHFIHGPNAERIPWLGPDAILHDAPPIPTQALVEFFARAVAAEAHIERLQQQLLEMRRSVVKRTGDTR